MIRNKEEEKKRLKKKDREKKWKMRRKRFDHMVTAANALIRLVNVLGYHLQALDSGTAMRSASAEPAVGPETAG